MKNKICASIDRNHIYNCTCKIIARTGEHESTELEITLAEELCNCWAYLDFRKPDGSTFKTPKLDIIDNKVIYAISAALVDQDGDIEVQLVLQNANGLIWKSSIKKYTVIGSINATDDIEVPEDFITNAQKLLDNLTEVNKDLEGYSVAKKEELENVKKGLETELINTKNTSVTEINNAASSGVSNVNSAASGGVNSVNSAASKALSDINGARESSLNEIGSAKTTAVNAIGTEKTSATTAITTLKEQSVKAISDLKETSINDITTLKNSSINEMETKQDELIAEMNSESAMLKIAALEKENAEQQKELEALYSEFEEKTTEERETVVISDGLDKSKIATKNPGNSKQETTTANLFDNEWELGQINSDGTLANSSLAIRTKNFQKVVPNVLYKLSRTITTSYMVFRFYDKDYNFLGSQATEGFVTTNQEDNRMYNGEASMELTINNTNIAYMKCQDNITDTTQKYTLTTEDTPSLNYKQDIEVIEAYNEFDKDNCGIYEGVINSSTDLLASTKGRKTIYIPCKPYTTYTIRKMITSRFIIGYTTEEVAENVKVYEEKTSNDATSLTITTGENAKYLCAFIYHSSYDTTITFDEILDSVMIYKGTGEKPYLPYGHIGLVQRGVQLLNLEDKTISSLNVDVVIKDGEITINGTPSTLNFNQLLITFVAPKTGTHSLHSFKSAVNNNIRFIYKINDTAWVNADQFPEMALNKGDTLTVNLRIMTTETISDFKIKPMLSEGSYKDKTYEPYIEPIVHSIDLAGNSIAKVGEIADLLNIGVDGSVKIGDKVIKRYVFTGDEYMITSSRTDVKRYVAQTIWSDNRTIKDNNRKDILCNYFKIITPNQSDGGNLGLSKYNETGVMFNLPLDTEFSTLELFKAWLKEKYDSGEPLYIDYVLANPKTIDLPSIEPITLIEGITNVFELVTNLGTTMAVTYKQSNKKRLDALENAILSLGGNV